MIIRPFLSNAFHPNEGTNSTEAHRNLFVGRLRQLLPILDGRDASPRRPCSLRQAECAQGVHDSAKKRGCGIRRSSSLQICRTSEFVVYPSLYLSSTQRAISQSTSERRFRNTTTCALSI